MNRQAVAHLLPSVQPVAVCAQQAKIALVRCPISEAVIPSRGAPFVAQLLARIDVVNVQNANVAVAALHASAPKLLHNLNLARPVARVLVRSEAVFAPMCLAALKRAKTRLAGLAATLASLRPAPPCREVARTGAVFSRPVFEAVLVGLERCGAVAASDCYRGLFHGRNISCRRANGNFDIACKRIEDAQRQGDLFIESAA